MSHIPNKVFAIFASMAVLMAATRFSHFGSAAALPDASLAIFFLCGLFLARFERAALVTFAALIVEAVAIDCYATGIQGVSDWCLTPAYWFLVPTYGGLWLAGRWFASHNALQGRGLLLLVPFAWAANSLAFGFSNVTFYLFSGHFADMSAAEYAGSVAQYYVSYVSVAMLYIACAVAIGMLAGILRRAQLHA